MAFENWRCLVCAGFLAFGNSVHAAPQQEGAGETGTKPPTAPTDGQTGEVGAKPPTDGAAEEGAKSPESTAAKPDRTLQGRFRALFSQEEDPDGFINTDRPTFTPANTVVNRGRLQFESGFTFNSEKAGTTRTSAYDFPEIGVRLGIFDRVEFRTFWLGQTYSTSQVRPGGPWPSSNGPSDMEVGFKWQVFAGDKKRKWLPTTALITSIITPTGGTSPYSSQTIEPYINLIYGWSLTDKFTLAGSTGYLGIRQQAAPGSSLHADNSQRFQQSLVAFYAVAERTTLFYEWYIFTFTNATDNRPQNYMDVGVLYRLSTNMQFDIRAGLGLSGRPDDFFTGAGFSVRF